MPLYSFEGHRPRIDPEAFIAPTATLIGDVTVEAGASIWYGVVLRGDFAPIVVRAGANVQDNAVVHTTPTGPVEIGPGTTVAHLCMVHGATLEAECLIGNGAIVLDGARIGARSMVAAGALVPPGMAVPGGVLVTGTDAKALAVSSLQVAHAALRRRKPLIALDLTGHGALAGVLGPACAATGTPLWAPVEAENGRWLGQAPDEPLLVRAVRERSAALFSLRSQDAIAQVCAGLLALDEDVRRIGADGDGLIWLYGYEPAPDGPAAGLTGSLVAGGAAAGLPVLVTTTSPRAVTELAGLVSVLLVHRLADPPTADILAARTGTKLVPVGWHAGERATTMPTAVAFSQTGSGQPGAAEHPGVAVWSAGGLQPAAVMPPAALTGGHPGFFQPAAALPPGVGMQPVAGMQPAMSMQYAGAMWPAASAAPSAAGFVPAPAVPARTLLSLGPAEFVLAVRSPRYRLVKLGQAVPARLPRGATP